MRFALALAVLAGCPPGEPPSASPPRPPRAPSCVEVADHVPALVELDPVRDRRVRDAFHARCSQDRWSPEVRTCLARLRSFAGPPRCKRLLTPAQHTAFDRDLATALGKEPAP